MIKKFWKKYSAMPLPAKAAVWFTICNLLLKGISFISVPIFTRLIPEEEYGLLSLFMSYEQIFLIFATWEIQLAAYQKGIFNYKNDEKIFTISTQCLINILTIICFGILFLFHKEIYQATNLSEELLFFLFLYLMVQPSYNCWLIRKRTAYAYKPAVVATLLYSLLNVIVPMAALFLIKRTAGIKFGATMLASVVFCLFFYLPNAGYRKLLHYKEKVKEQWKFLIRFQGPMILHSLSYLVLAQADRIMIGNMVGNVQVAYYSVAYSFANAVSILQNSINQSLLPWRYQMLEQRQYVKIRKTTNYLLGAIALFVLLFILVAPEMIRFLFTDSYYEAVWCIPSVSASAYFMFLYSIIVDVETYFEKTNYIMYVSVVCSVLKYQANNSPARKSIAT